mmetsp:Transcript_5387/g.7210  ORF Transcript_5387/g.7210 Transcript_5387/m.7210 type:complete len:307 (+) Transcript_5387:324-1244(+)
MAGSLDTGHHEGVFLRKRLHDALLFLLLGDLVFDLSKVELHIGGPVTLVSGRALDGAVDETGRVRVTVVASVHGESLLDVEADAVCSDLAVLVVHVNLAAGELSWDELVLLEDTPHSGSALIAAAPSLDVAGLGLLLANLERNGLLADDEHLLVLHDIVAVVLKLGLNVILDLGLRLLARVLVLEVERRGDVVGQVELEVDLVEARLEHAINNGEHLVLLVKELLRVLAFLGLVHDSSLIAVMLRLRVVANEGALLATLELDLDVSGGDRGVDLEVDLAGDGVAGLVEGALSLQLDVASLELAPVV